MDVIRLALCLLVVFGPVMPTAAAVSSSPTVIAASDKQTSDRPGQEAYVEGRHAGGQQRQAQPGNVANSQGHIEKPLEYPIERPCKYGEKDLDSDLCAQWYAAKGATDGASYAFWGMVVGAFGTALILISLHYARRGTALAAEAVCAAKDAIRIAESANGQAAEANRLAADANRTSIADFNERMRPRCVIVGMRLDHRWQQFINAGSDFPLSIAVENLGGATGRHLLIEIDQIALRDRAGKVVASSSKILRLAPLRVGQPRSEKMVIRHNAAGKEVCGITVRGRIGSMGDTIEGSNGKLTMVEEFIWREDPLHRSSRDLVELAAGENREGSDQDVDALPPAAPALGGVS